jgi:orotate phosphoribosyltransferase
VLIVEDIITTGGSVVEVINEVKKFNSTIAGIGCLVDRSNGSAKFDYPFKPLLTLDVVSYKPDVCPLCKSSVPFVKPGSTNK